MQHRPAEGTGYQDPLVMIRNGTLVIRHHRFPTGTKPIRAEAFGAVLAAAGIPTSPKARGRAGQRP